METRLQGQELLELYTVLPEKTLNMWIACGRIPTSYMKMTTDNRHKYYIVTTTSMEKYTTRLRTTSTST
eukprot:1794917-Amphidinium_carterae.1